MLDATMTQQLQATLGYLRHPILLTAALDDSKTSRDMASLLDAIAGCSDKVTVGEPTPPSDTDVRRPSFAIHRVGEDARVRFAGVPLGHEFTSLVLALLHVGGHPPRIADEQLEQVEGLAGPLHFETFFSQSCQNCPDVVQALNILAARNPNVTHVAIDGASFREEVQRREVMAVPTILLNGEPFGSGRMELAQVLAKVDTGAAEREAAALDAKDAFDMLIVGGGPAGAAAAVYAARKGIATGIVAERFGGQVADTLGIENFIGTSYTEGPKMVAAMEAHVGDYEVDVMKHQRATRLVPGTGSPDGLVHVALDSGATLKSKTVVVATGARWRDLGVPGEREHRNKGVTYCPHCDGPLFKGKRVAVVGGGNSGVEAAIDLAGVVAHVTVLEFMGELKADAVLQRKLHSLPNVDVVLNAKTTEIVGDGKAVQALRYEDRQSGETQDVAVAGVFVQIGLLPNTQWLEGSVELSSHGEIVVDDHGRTNVPGVFAAGDATTVPYKQIVIAAGDGAKAALGAFDHLIRTVAPE